MTDSSDPRIPPAATWHMDDLTRSQTDRWHEFFRIPAMSMGVYQLKGGETDPQLPHTEDEVYYIVRGKASIQVEDIDYACKPGTIIFVRKQARHKFIKIEEDLTILVFFAPAEGSLED